MLRLGSEVPIVPDLDFEVPLVDGMLATALQNNCSGKHVGMMLLAQRPRWHQRPRPGMIRIRIWPQMVRAVETDDRADERECVTMLA